MNLSLKGLIFLAIVVCNFCVVQFFLYNFKRNIDRPAGSVSQANKQRVAK
jgi:hypothetical protein